jgi:hypothetical protein
MPTGAPSGPTAYGWPSSPKAAPLEAISPATSPPCAPNWPTCGGAPKPRTHPSGPPDHAT